MPVRPSDQVVNLMIDGLPRRHRERVLSRCTPVRLEFGTALCKPGAPITHVHFPLTGFISLVSPVRGRRPLETGMIGNEGVLGATLALGVGISPLQATVQGTGSALRMTATQFRHELRECPRLHRAVDRYLYSQIGELARSAACNRFHEVSARLARWLLMTHDRAHGEPLRLTHLFLADMLGVRRSAVTIAAGELQERAILQYMRGRIVVMSRRGLERAACDCYSMTAKANRRLAAA